MKTPLSSYIQKQITYTSCTEKLNKVDFDITVEPSYNGHFVKQPPPYYSHKFQPIDDHNREVPLYLGKPSGMDRNQS